MVNHRTFPGFLAEWKKLNGEKFAPLMYLNFPGSLRSVVVAQWLYVPDFVEYRGGVFVAGIPEGLTEAKKKSLDRAFKDFDGNILRKNLGSGLLRILLPLSHEAAAYPSHGTRGRASPVCQNAG
jgi:hypothetical protein